MPRTRQALAEDLASELHEAERAVEIAFQKVVSLSARYPEYRRSARLAHTVGQDIYVSGLKAHSAAVALRGAMTEMHDGLNSLRGELGLAPTAGVGEDKGPYDKNAVPLWSTEASALPDA